MKKIKAVVAVVVLMLMVGADSSVVYAAEEGVTVVPGNITERILSEAEIEALPMEMIQMGMLEENQISSVSSSYEIHEYSQVFDFYLDGTWIAQADAACIVYRYTDGKVHLYSRNIGLRSLAYYDGYITYGRIVNTDGSVCYTTGDSVTVYDFIDMWTYAIDFAATATGQSFSCYPITY